MKNLKLLLLMFLLFFGKIGYSQNTVTYTNLSTTIDLKSGVEGTVDILVNCYGKSSTPVYLNAILSCGNNDGILSTTYTNGSILTPGENTTIRYKFKKTLTTDTQITYKFSTNGSCFQKESEMIKITVNYKAGTTTTPPGTIPPEMIFIGGPGGTISTTINEGDIAPVISGTGKGNYTYQWYKTINGVFTLISGATSYYYYPGTPFVTTKYFRQNILGPNVGRSNEVEIKVINNAPAILNNTIVLNGKTINGSLPTGGVGGNSYLYSWYILFEDGDSSELPDTSQSLDLSTPSFNRYLYSINNFKLIRMVVSGTQRSRSNDVLVPYAITTDVYPNPTSGTVNFTTSSSSIADMEITAYSLVNTILIFRGPTTPNQIVKWDIPSSLPKGLYYYKVVSDNKEIKSGKILYQ